MSCSSRSINREPSKFVAPYDGRKFDNLEPYPDKTFWDLLKWRWSSSSQSEPWPDRSQNPVFKVGASRSKELNIAVVNHSTILIQMDNLNILTDPVYSERASPVSWAGPKRIIAPGIQLDDLPPIDIVLISHNHYDHLDIATLKILDSQHSPTFYVGLGTQEFLKENGIRSPILELDWWEMVKVNDEMTVNFVPAQHWSARGIWDKREMLWGGFYLSGSRSVYFAGDTGYGHFFKTVKERLGKPNLAFLPIGAYEPRWFMKHSHMNPEEAVLAFKDLEAGMAVAIHFGTFKLTDEGVDQPVLDLKAAINEHGISLDHFIVPEFGKSYGF